MRRRIEVVCPGCSERRTVLPSNMRHSKTGLCRACDVRSRHGISLSPNERSSTHPQLHNIWRGTLKRCGHVAGGKPYNLLMYRDRGIFVCDEWRSSFAAFRDWALSNGYARGLILDRSDNDREYSPGNCRWVDSATSMQNRTISKLNAEQVVQIKAAIAAGKTQAAVAGEFGVSPSVIYSIASEESWAGVPWPNGYIRRKRVGVKRLDEASASAIKQRLSGGGRIADLAREFGVATTTIRAIKEGRTWTYV